MARAIKAQLSAWEWPWVPPWAAVSIGVVAVSFASVFVRLSSAPPLVIATWRMGLATLMLAPFALAGARHGAFAMKRTDFILSLFAGGFLAVHFGAWMTSLSLTSVASSAVLVETHPLFVMLASRIMFGEVISGWALAGAASACAGSAIVGLGDSVSGEAVLAGDLLAVLSALMFACYALVGRGVRQRLSVVPYAFVVYGTCTVILAAVCTVRGLRLYPYPVRDYVLFLALAAIPTILGHTVFNWALRYVSASAISVSVLGEPVGATVLAMILLKETPPVTAVIGGVLVVSGIAVFTRFSARGGAGARPAAAHDDTK